MQNEGLKSYFVSLSLCTRRKHSSTDDSDGGSSSGDETSGSDSSSSDNSDRDHRRSAKKDSSARSKGDESTPGRSKQDEHPSGDSDKERRKGKAVSDSGELSSSDGEHVPRSGPRSTVVQVSFACVNLCIWLCFSNKDKITNSEIGLTLISLTLSVW